MTMNYKSLLMSSCCLWERKKENLTMQWDGGEKRMDGWAMLKEQQE